MHKILPLTLGLLLLAGCTSIPLTAYPNEAPAPAYANPPAAGESGIEGQVLIGPTCPVVQEGDKCADKPYQTTLTLLNPQGELILRFETDAEGRFKIPLPSGKYVLHPETTGRYPFAAEQEFTVTTGEYTQITITYESGIR